MHTLLTTRLSYTPLGPSASLRIPHPLSILAYRDQRSRPPSAAGILHRIPCLHPILSAHCLVSGETLHIRHPPSPTLAHPHPQPRTPNPSRAVRAAYNKQAELAVPMRRAAPPLDDARDLYGRSEQVFP